MKTFHLIHDGILNFPILKCGNEGDDLTYDFKVIVKSRDCNSFKFVQVFHLKLSRVVVLC